MREKDHAYLSNITKGHGVIIKAIMHLYERKKEYEKHRRILALLTALSLCAAFTACSKDDKVDSSVPDSAPAVEQDAEDSNLSAEADGNEDGIPENPYNNFSDEEMAEYGFSYDKDGNVVDAGGRIIVSVVDGSAEPLHEEETTEASGLPDAPKQEIIDADLSSGLIFDWQ